MSVLAIHREDAVVTLTINRPEKLNTLNAQVLSEFVEAVTTLDADPSVRVAIVTGAGEKAFAAGADIEGMREMTAPQAKHFAELGHRLGALVEHSRLPFIAAVQGFALGGGCELAMACDFIYASDKAKLGQPEINLGIIPGFGGTQRLTRRVGVGRARELCMTGDILGAEEARQIGLVDAVFPHADLSTKVRERAAKIAGKAPLAIAAIKRVILRGQDMALASANELEAAAFASLFGTFDQREGMQAFAEKRPPVFQGR